MLQAADMTEATASQSGSLLGPGWREVPTFEDVEDGDKYEEDEEESYVVLDLGTAVDGKTILTEGTYQLIGMDTATPFIKIGDHILRGELSSLIGEEVILGLHRSPSDIAPACHPPLYKTMNRITFHPVTLTERTAHEPEHASDRRSLNAFESFAGPFSRNAEAGPSRLGGAAYPSVMDDSNASVQAGLGSSATRSTGLEALESPRGASRSRVASTPTARSRPVGRPPNPDRKLVFTSASELLDVPFDAVRRDARIEIQPNHADNDGAEARVLKYASIKDYEALEQAVQSGAKVVLTKRQAEILVQSRKHPATAEPGKAGTQEGRRASKTGGAGAAEDGMDVDDNGEVHPEARPGAVAGDGEASAPRRPAKPRRAPARVAGEDLLSMGAPRRNG